MSLANLDTSFPRFTNETTEERVAQIQDYLYILLENLRYTLNNLDEGNWNPTSLSKITEPVSAKIKDLEGNVHELEITATGLTSRVTDAEGNINSIEQTLTGVAFKSSLAAGTTTINGGCITTGSIDAQRIGTGTLTIGNNQTHGKLVLDNFSSFESFSTGELDIISEEIVCDCNSFSVNAAYRSIEFETGSSFNVTADGVVSINSDAVNGITLTANGSSVKMTNSTGNYPCFYPGTDDDIKLGYPSKRWEAVYAANGTIQTSDRRKKLQRKEAMSDYDEFFRRLKAVSFEWKDKVDHKQRNGFYAQDVERLLTECGFKADNCGFLDKNPDGNGDYSYGLNYQWLIPLLVDKVQRLEEKING